MQQKQITNNQPEGEVSIMESIMINYTKEKKEERIKREKQKKYVEEEIIKLKKIIQSHEEFVIKLVKGTNDLWDDNVKYHDKKCKIRNFRTASDYFSSKIFITNTQIITNIYKQRIENYRFKIDKIRKEIRELTLKYLL